MLPDAGGEDHRSEGGVVLWAAVCGREGPEHLAQAQQEGKINSTEDPNLKSL